MKKSRAKLSLLLLLFAVMLTACLALAACAQSAYKIRLERTSVTLEKGEQLLLEYSVTKNGEPYEADGVTVEVAGDAVAYDKATNKITAVKAGKAEVALSFKGASAKLSVTVPLYELELKGNAVEKVDLGAEDIIEYTVLKDGSKVTDKRVNITVDGNALKYTQIGNRVAFVAEGEGVVTASLADDPAVTAQKTYKVAKSFWNSNDHQVNKDSMTITDNSVYMPGGSGSQYFLGVLEGGVKYVFKTKLTIPASSALGSQTVGVTHDLDRNNAGLWFGINSPDGANGGNYRIYIKNFYGGWAGQDFVKYTNVEFSSDTVDVITVRDGSNFWFSIDGYCGTFTLPAQGDKNYISAETQTWAGIFSQERRLTATDFSYSTEAEAVEQAKAVCESPVARFEITNSGVNKLVKGTTFTYSAKVIASNPANIPAVEWSLDKSAMTSGADGTTITDGTLSLAADAAGTVTVIAECGGKQVRIPVEILSHSLADENETVAVDGGVVLGDDGTVAFTEEFNYNNTTLNDTDYTDIYYSAKLKNPVRGDFEFAFTLTDMQSASTPAFLVSLGNSFGNFIFTSNSVSIKTQFVNPADKSLEQGAVTATFAAADALNVVISVVGGHYKVTVNGVELDFAGKALVRRIEDYTASRPVLFTTGAGTSVKVSQIAITDKSDAEYVVLNDNTTLVSGGIQSAMIPAKNGSWVGKDKGVSTTFWGDLLPAGDYTVAMDVKFSAPMSDAKLGIQIGNWEYHVNNKIASQSVIHGQLYAGSWGDAPNKNSGITTINSAFKVTIKKINGTAYFYIGSTLIAEHANAPADRILKLWTFDDGSTPAGETVTVTNLTVTDSAAIVTLTGDGAVQVGSSATYKVTVLGGNENDVVWSLNKDGLTSGADGTTFDAATRTLTFANDAQGFVVITATLNGVVAELTVTASDQPADQNTSLAESKGGVKQDVANGKLIFDDAAAEGVADEQRYTEAGGYYAILNTAQSTRATIQDNFILEFTVSDYVTTARFPKLMISLGGKFEQFYIAYTQNGARVELFNGYGGANSNGGSWLNSQYFADFDMSASHTYQIKCEDGYYGMTVDGIPVTGWHNGVIASATPLRSPESMALARNIMFSTNSGTTATVSDISLKEIAGKEGKVTKTFAEWFKENADGSVTATMSSQTPNNRDGYHNIDRIYSYGEYIADNSVIEMNVKFNGEAAYTDEALLIKFGSDRSIGVVYNNGSNKIEVQHAWGGTPINADALKDGALKIKITVANGVVSAVQFMQYGEGGAELGYNYNVNLGNEAIPNIGVMSFATFIYQTPSNATVTVSNITVTNS